MAYRQQRERHDVRIEGEEEEQGQAVLRRRRVVHHPVLAGHPCTVRRDLQPDEPTRSARELWRRTAQAAVRCQLQ